MRCRWLRRRKGGEEGGCGNWVVGFRGVEGLAVAIKGEEVRWWRWVGLDGE